MALALKAQEVAKLLAQCAEKHAAAVNAYRDARADALRWNEGEAK